ncbi:hypothetical protein CAEBREN_15493 [Caenorhabditis brenneri]|uniref:Uncharacterized protein n=1 Tax=Caenorhabditis brenneri TaxID=135651 RepID=G0MWH4_CAEBE|nr:hypothetical protein CAEBREN_15493 [Caenorhabditis brenneri]
MNKDQSTYPMITKEIDMVVAHVEKEVSGYQKVERDIPMRQIYVYNEDRI